MKLDAQESAKGGIYELQQRNEHFDSCGFAGA